MEEDEKWSTATLRIRSDLMTADEISTVLNTRPTRLVEKGIPVSRRIPTGPVMQNAVWLLESGLPTDQPLEMHVAKLIQYIEDKQVPLKELLLKCEIDLVCGFSSGNGQGGFVLDAKLLKKLTIIPIDFVLDLYPPEK